MRRSGPTTAVLLAVVLAVGCSPVTSVSKQAPPPVVEKVPVSTTTTSLSGSTTTPSPETRSLLVIGDWGTGTDVESEIAAAMESYAADHAVEAILTTGDDLYIDDGDAALAPFGWVAKSGIEWWVAWGNHDVTSRKRIQEVERVFSSPPRWMTVEWGAVDIVILDSNDMGSAEQRAFLESEMKSSDRPTVVVLHHPPLNCSVHGDNTAFWDLWQPLFDDDVVLVLSGHAHNYQRFDDEGVQYVVTGGGSRKLYGLTDCPADHVPRAVGAEVFHFLTLTQGPDGLGLTALTPDGSLVDDITIPLG